MFQGVSEKILFNMLLKPPYASFETKFGHQKYSEPIKFSHRKYSEPIKFSQSKYRRLSALGSRPTSFHIQ